MDKMKIVVLERNSVGVDTPVDCFEELGEVTLYANTTTAEEVRERTKDADIIIANKAPMNEESLKDSPKVKIICEFVCNVIIVLTSPMLMIVGFYFMGLTNYAVSIPNYRLGISLVIMGFVGTIFWGRAFADMINRSMKR